MGAPLALGVDGAVGGWVVAAEYGDRTVVELVPDLSHVVALAGGGQCPVAIDVPIGLPPDVRFRLCDRHARSLLRERRNAVFMPPGRFLLGATTFTEVQRRVEEERRKMEPASRGLSRQAFELLGKISEVDEFARAEPACEEWLLEVHPEVCFAELNGGEPLAPKRTSWGRTARTLLVGAAFADVADALERARLRLSLLGDALDAYAALWTAKRFARGAASTLGGERDDEGVVMRMLV